jgi:hypothetical protein
LKTIGIGMPTVPKVKGGAESGPTARNLPVFVDHAAAPRN